MIAGLNRSIGIEESIKKAEIIGVLSSPSTNITLTIDLLQEAEDKNIIGNFAVIYFKQDRKDTILIGQIDSLQLRNPYLERHSIQKIISVRKDAPPLTKLHDVRLINMNIGTAYSIDYNLENNNYSISPTNLGSLPPTGTLVYLLNKELMDRLFSAYSNELFYIGTIYNTGLLLPTVFKHFGDPPAGLGEAYHLGIFGKTGSGKSVLAKMLISAYVRHDEMSILIIDPQGEFSKEFSNRDSPLRLICAKYGRRNEVYDISTVSLTTFASFAKLLKISNILKEMGIIAEENQDNAIRVLREILENRQDRLITLSLDNCYDRNNFDHIVNELRRNVQRIYATEESQNRVKSILGDRRQVDRIYNNWSRIAILFSTQNNRRSINDIIRSVCAERMIITLNLSETTASGAYWDDSVLAIVLKEIIDALKQEGSSRFNNGQRLNLLVCIDEAHRFAPRERPENEYYAELKNSLIDAVRTTRKYGLGWLFISQTLASLDSEILNQLRLYFFGYGLSWGSELRTLREIVGGKEDTYINIYQNFKDPQSAAILGKREFPFMGFGPISLLSVSGAPVFFYALNYNNKFIDANRIRDART